MRTSLVGEQKTRNDFDPSSYHLTFQQIARSPFAERIGDPDAILVSSSPIRWSQSTSCDLFKVVNEASPSISVSMFFWYLLTRERSTMHCRRECVMQLCTILTGPQHPDCSFQICVGCAKG